MNFADAVFIRLADPASRVSVFDDMALEQILSAIYDVDTLALEGPFQPVFDEFRLGISADLLATADGSWSLVGGVDRTEIQLRFMGLGHDVTARADAIWRGAIVARVVPLIDQVADMATAFPSTDGIDEEIIAQLGDLPTEPVALEAERRSRFMARVRGAVAQPLAVTDAVFDDWLRRLGAGSVSDLLAQPRVAAGGAVQVAFSPPASAPATPTALPITAIVLIRDEGFSVAELLAESRSLRDRLGAFGVQRAREPTLAMREPVVVIWVVPPAVFGDAAWPGGGEGDADEQRANRRTAAGAWLAREGIGLAVTTAPP